MNDDIVARLRKEISKRDRPYPVELLPELREAADEIDRLRDQLHLANIDCFNTAAEVDRLRTQLEMWQDGNIMAESHHEEIKRLTAERDEARESYCLLMEAYRGGDGRVTANKLGWGYLFAEDNPCQ